MAKAKTTQKSDALLKHLRAFGLLYPGAHTKAPWPGHLDLAVNDKIFAHLSIEGEPFSMSCKLPHSSAVALLLPFAEPTGYGMGKHGWVSARLPAGAALPEASLLESWIDESYRAIAPKRLVAQLDHGAKEPAAVAPAKKKAAAKKAPARKSVAKEAVAKKAPARKTPATKSAAPKKAR